MKTETDEYVEYLHKQINNLRMQYEKSIEPYVNELVKIESMRMKPMSVNMSKKDFDRMFQQEGTGLTTKPEEGLDFGGNNVHFHE